MGGRAIERWRPPPPRVFLHKSVEITENKEVAVLPSAKKRKRVRNSMKRKGDGGTVSERARNLKSEGYPHPLFFVSVASEGLKSLVSLLDATLASWCVSVAGKGLSDGG